MTVESISDVRNQIKKDIDARILIANGNAEELEAIRDRLWNMIQYAIARHDYFDNYREKYLTIATALVTVAAAGLAIIVNAKIQGAPAVTLYLAFASLGLTGGLLIFRFKQDTSPNYPYRELSHVDSWFYLYTLTKDSAQREKKLRDSMKKDSIEWANAKAEFVSGLKGFSQRWISKSLSDWIQEDLEQVLILFTLQAYKSMFVKRMATNLSRGLVIFSVMLVASVLAYLFWGFGFPAIPAFPIPIL